MNTIEKIADLVVKISKQYGYKYPGMIIAQAVLESGINGSGLSNGYNNFWGMKCGSSYKGKSVNMKTREEYTPGTLTTIRDNFRAYDTVELGVIGYFEFIKMTRYQNLKDATSAEDYALKIKQDGWATSSAYTQNLIKIYNNYGLSKYDNAPAVVKDKTPVILAVKSLQNALNAYGNYGLKVDGVIGPLTLGAYENFKK